MRLTFQVTLLPRPLCLNLGGGVNRFIACRNQEARRLGSRVFALHLPGLGLVSVLGDTHDIITIKSSSNWDFVKLECGEV